MSMNEEYLRFLCATTAMEGLLASSTNTTPTDIAIVRHAVKLADLLLAELEKNELQ